MADPARAALLVPLPNVPSAADAVFSGSPVPGSALLSSALVSASSSPASLLFLYALHIASIPFRVSTNLKPAQQLNRSLSGRRSIISLTHFARCPPLLLYYTRRDCLVQQPLLQKPKIANRCWSETRLISCRYRIKVHPKAQRQSVCVWPKRASSVYKDAHGGRESLTARNNVPRPPDGSTALVVSRHYTVTQTNRPAIDRQASSAYSTLGSAFTAAVPIR